MSTPTPVTWPKAPYKGLSYYTPRDVAMFAGRQTDVRDCARLLAEERSNVFLLQGRSGCGKSSFLRAGLIPYLESRVPVFKFLPDFDITRTQALFIRCTDAPLTRLAETLYDWSCRPFTIDTGEPAPLVIDTASIRSETTDRATFVERTGSSVEELLRVLRRIHQLLPKRLIIVIDQGEEILTLARGEEAQPRRELFFTFVSEFSRSSLSLKVVIALRSEFFGDFLAEMRNWHLDPSQLEWFLLKELSDRGLVEAIKIPTSRSIPVEYLQGRRQPADEYGFRFAEGLPEAIVRDLLQLKNKQGGVLPILQIACGRLYAQAKERSRNRTRPWEIGADDYKRLGELGRQVEFFLDETIRGKVKEELPGLDEAGAEEELALWKDLLCGLVVVEEDGRSLTDIFSEADLRRAAHDLGCKVEFDTMVGYLADEDQRILRRDPRSAPGVAGLGEAKMQYYSLGHDAIAVTLTKWRPTRELVLDRRGFMKRTLLTTIRLAAAVLLAGAGVVLFASFGRSTGTLAGPVASIGLLLAALALFVGRARISDYLSLIFVNPRTVAERVAREREKRVVIRRMQASFNVGQSPQPSSDEKQVLQGLEEALRAKPEKDYTAGDWAERAFASYAQRKLDLAAEYFARAADASKGVPARRAQWLYNRGVMFNELNRMPEALAAYDEVIAEFAGAAEPAVRTQVAMALFNKGVALGQLGRGEEALAVYGDVVARFGDAAEPALREQVAMALVNKGVALGQLGHGEEALAVYGDVVARFGDAAEPALREQVAMALFNKGVALGQLGRGEEELAAYADVVARFGEAAEPGLREQVAKALVNKGITLGQLRRGEEALAAYADVVARFGEAVEPALREQVAKALVNKGVRLGELGRGEEELAAYADVVARFGEAAEPALREQVAMALVNKGVRLGQLGRGEEEVAAYGDVVARFGEAAEPALREQVAKALVNKGITLGQLGRGEEELAAYADVVARFGDVKDPAIIQLVEKARGLIGDRRS